MPVDILDDNQLYDIVDESLKLYEITPNVLWKQVYLNLAVSANSLINLRAKSSIKEL